MVKTPCGNTEWTNHSWSRLLDLVLMPSLLALDTVSGMATLCFSFHPSKSRVCRESRLRQRQLYQKSMISYVFSGCISYFSPCCDQLSQIKQTEGGRDNLAHGLKEYKTSCLEDGAAAPHRDCCQEAEGRTPTHSAHFSILFSLSPSLGKGAASV